MTVFATAMRIDHEHDIVATTGDGTRFGAALQAHHSVFQDEGVLTDDPVRFAWAAWQISRPPLTSPGYVRLHDRIVRVWLTMRNGALGATVELASTLPNALYGAAALAGDIRSWLWSDDGGFVEPRTDPSTAAVLPLLVIRVVVAPHALPAPRYDRDGPCRATAIEAVEAICDAVNMRVGPVLDVLARPARPW